MKLLHQHSTLSAALLIFVIFGVFLLTLMPFDFRFPESIQISWATSFKDIIENIFLFIPPGFLFRLYRKKEKDPLFLLTFGFGLMLSLIIECAQLFVPGRHTQPIDVITNGIGAWLGALLFKVLEKGVKGRSWD